MNGKKLAIFLPSLASGGAERVHINLAPEFIRKGWDVTFLLQKKEGALLDQVPAGAHIVSLNAKSTFGAFKPLARYMNSAKPDILLSNLGHNNIVAIWARLLGGAKTRVIASQHSILSIECADHPSWRYKILPLLSRMFLRFADGIVAISQGVADDLAKMADIKRQRVSVIYNPIVFAGFDTRMREPVNHPWLQNKTLPVLVAAGRLVPLKDFATLLDAFALVNAQKPCRLILLGEGPLREELIAHAASLQLSDTVSFAGFQPNILPYMREADALVMSSRYEGFGNVLVEAMACGTPVVSTACPCGPAEIITDARYGMLVPVADPAAMAEAILATIARPADKQALLARGHAFTAAQSAEGYLSLFAKL